MRPRSAYVVKSLCLMSNAFDHDDQQRRLKQTFFCMRKITFESLSSVSNATTSHAARPQTLKNRHIDAKWRKIHLRWIDPHNSENFIEPMYYFVMRGLIRS